MRDGIHSMYPEELAEMMAEYNLPELPEPQEDYDEANKSLIFYSQEEDTFPVYLVENVSADDAREYASRDDTHGPGWFVGFDAA